MAEREYTPDEARKLEEKYQAGTMAPANRPLWEQRREKYRQMLPGEQGTPPLTRVQTQPQPPATLQAIPPTAAPAPAVPEAKPSWKVSLFEPKPEAKQLPAGVDLTKITGPGSYLEQVGRLQQHAASTEAEAQREHPEVAELGSTIFATTMLNLVPGGQVVSAARYAQMAPKARMAYWTLKEVLQPFVRRGVIGLGVGGVPLLFGRPMSEALQTALFEFVGANAGAGKEKIHEGVATLLRKTVSPEGREAGETLTKLGARTTVGEMTGSPTVKRVEEAFKPPLWRGRVRRIEEEGTKVLENEVRKVEQRLSPAEIHGNPDVLVKESINVAKSSLDETAAERFGGIDLMIANRQRPETGAYPRSPREPVGPERANVVVDPQTGKIVMRSEPTAQTPVAARPPLPTGRVPTDRVPLGPMKAEAARLLHQTQRTGVPTNEGQALLMSVLNNPADSLTFADAQKLLSNWLKVSRGSDELIAGQAHGFATKLSRILYSELDTVARSNGAEVHEAWRATRDWYKTAIKTFDDPLIDRLTSAAPDKVYSLIAAEASPIAIRKAREAINNPLLWGRVQQSWLRNVLGDKAITDPRTQHINGEALLKRLKDFAGSEGNALRELFPAGHGEDIYTLAKALAQIQRGGGAAPWNRVIQALPGGGVALILGYELPHQSAQRQYESGEEGTAPERRRWPYWLGPTLILSPALMARIFTSQKMTRAILEGTRASVDAKRRMETAGGILALLTEAGLFKGEGQPDVPVAAPQGSP